MEAVHICAPSLVFIAPMNPQGSSGMATMWVASWGLNAASGNVTMGLDPLLTSSEKVGRSMSKGEGISRTQKQAQGNMRRHINCWVAGAGKRSKEWHRSSRLKLVAASLGLWVVRSSGGLATVIIVGMTRTISQNDEISQCGSHCSARDGSTRQNAAAATASQSPASCSSTGHDWWHFWRAWEKMNGLERSSPPFNKGSVSRSQKAISFHQKSVRIALLVPWWLADGCQSKHNWGADKHTVDFYA